jgi:hypothetical protein
VVDVEEVVGSWGVFDWDSRIFLCFYSCFCFSPSYPHSDSDSYPSLFPYSSSNSFFDLHHVS